MPFPREREMGIWLVFVYIYIFLTSRLIVRATGVEGVGRNGIEPMEKIGALVSSQHIHLHCWGHQDPFIVFNKSISTTPFLPSLSAFSVSFDFFLV